MGWGLLAWEGSKEQLGIQLWNAALHSAPVSGLWFEAGP